MIHSEQDAVLIKITVLKSLVSIIITMQQNFQSLIDKSAQYSLELLQCRHPVKKQ